MGSCKNFIIIIKIWDSFFAIYFKYEPKKIEVILKCSITEITRYKNLLASLQILSFQKVNLHVVFFLRQKLPFLA